MNINKELGNLAKSPKQDYFSLAILGFVFLSILTFLLSNATTGFNRSINSDSYAQSVGDRTIIVDHHSVDLFDDIPAEYLEAAREIRMLYMDRSVGGNIDQGLDCLSIPEGTRVPNYCIRDLPPTETFNNSSAYNRDNWDYEFWDAVPTNLTTGGWSRKVEYFVNRVNQEYSNYDVMSFQLSYLSVDNGSNIAEPGGFFSNNSSLYDIYDVEALQVTHPDKVFIHWTSSLARSIGTDEATAFNDQMRNYVDQNGGVLFDVADITSHDTYGNPCYDNRDGVYYSNGNRSENHPDDGQNIPAICQQYTTETDGGHLGAMGTGRVRVAKAYWVLMAQIAGWNPDGTPNPDPDPDPDPDPTTPTMSVVDVDLLETNNNSNENWNALVNVLVRSNEDNQTVSANIIAEWQYGGNQQTIACNGSECSSPNLSFNNDQVTFSVLSVSDQDYDYDPTMNRDPDDDYNPFQNELVIMSPEQDPDPDPDPEPDPDPTGNVISVSNIETSIKEIPNGWWQPRAEVYVVDQDGNAMPGVTVSGEFTTINQEVECTTNGAGWCPRTVTVTNTGINSVEFVVTGLEIADYEYDADANSVTSITISR